MKERKIERETHYEYGADGELSSMTVNETITNPSCEDCGLIDEAKTVTGELEATVEHNFADIAFSLAAIGLAVAAIATVFKKNKE